MSRKEALWAHICALRTQLHQLEQELFPDGQDQDGADVVQLKPNADPAFGGLLMRVKKRTPYELRGYLLLPRRGGSMETWTRVKHDEVTPVGHLAWPEAQYGFRQYEHVYTPQMAARDAKSDADIRDYWARTSSPPRKRPARQETDHADNRRIDCGRDP